MRIFFDLDGTLSDPYEGISASIVYALKKLEFPVSNDDFRWCIGPSLSSSFAQILNTSCRDTLRKAVELYRERFGTVGLYENYLYDGIPSLLSELTQMQCQLFLATAKPTYYAEQILHHFQIYSYFENIYGSELNGERTDKKDLLRYALEQSPNDQNRLQIMIGDRAMDIESAKAHGLISIAVRYGYGTEIELTAAKPDYIVSNVAELNILLKKLQGGL